MKSLSSLIQGFFAERLITQWNCSSHTVASYRDTFRLLLQFAQFRLETNPCDLQLGDLTAELITDFLNDLECYRKNSIRTRNARLAAIRSFFKYVSVQEPTCLGQIHRILATPQKKYEKKIVQFLNDAEVNAILEVPDRNNWLGMRDYTLLLLAIQTGLRVSEITGLRCEDVSLGQSSHIRCEGKGRKRRCTPLTRDTANAMRSWLRKRAGLPGDPLFPSIRGDSLSRDSVEHLVKKYTATASQKVKSLQNKTISPHILRHTAAVRLLQAGVDRSVIALWLGHEQVETTQIYLHADLSIKEKALARTAPLTTQSIPRYRPDDSLLAFLQGL